MVAPALRSLEAPENSPFSKMEDLEKFFVRWLWWLSPNLLLAQWTQMTCHLTAQEASQSIHP